MAQKADDLPPVSSSSMRMLIITGIILGIVLALMLIPVILPGLRDSLLGSSPKAYWYLARASGLVAYALLWASVAMGLLISGRVSRVWPGGPTAIDLHNFLSIFGLLMVLFHVAILLGDQYMAYSVFSLLIPFASVDYRPLEVGLGQLGMYLGWMITLSFYVRKKIGPRVWRRLHYGSFAVYLLITVHGVLAGTDTLAVPVMVLYAVTSAVTFFLVIYRILATVKPEGHPARREPSKARTPTPQAPTPPSPS
ncbi:MAG TPA: hypothetical protein VI855_09305 [Dehalococcoidia bacterium]|nr:hypothetical protein [Dehalococcoidia bacterium]